MSAAFDLDFTELWKKIDATKSAIRRDLALAVRRSCDQGVRVAKRGTFKDRTGQLRATITTHVLGWRGNTFWMQIHAPMPYAHFVDVGTKPHDIPLEHRPPGKPLHFFWEKRGVWFTGYHVRHPGTKANRFFETAIDATRLKLAGELMRGEFSNIRSVWS